MWIKSVNEEVAVGKLKAIYDRVRESRGRVSEIFRAQSLRPDVLATHLDLYLSIMFGQGGLPRKEREMIAVLVSSINECPYCVAHHSAALARYGVALSDMKDLKGADQKTKQMLRYAEKLTREPGRVAEADVNVLKRAGFGDEEILQINVVTSYFNFANRIVSGLGVQLEEDRGEGYHY